VESLYPRIAQLGSAPGERPATEITYKIFRTFDGEVGPFQTG
jgi:hypothetical protein